MTSCRYGHHFPIRYLSYLEGTTRTWKIFITMGCLQVHLCWEDREPQHTVSEASGGCRQISAFRAERDMRGNEPVIYLWEALCLSLVTCCRSDVLLNSHVSTLLLDFRGSVLSMFIYARRCVLARLLQCFYYIIISLFFSDVSVIYFFPAKLLLFGIREMLFSQG